MSKSRFIADWLAAALAKGGSVLVLSTDKQAKYEGRPNAEPFIIIDDEPPEMVAEKSAAVIRALSLTLGRLPVAHVALKLEDVNGSLDEFVKSMQKLEQVYTVKELPGITFKFSHESPPKIREFQRKSKGDKKRNRRFRWTQ